MKTNGNDAAFQKEKWMTSAVPNMPPEQFGGLTKRELFAAMAMQGLLATNGSHFPDSQNFGELTAIASVKYAEALIKALNEKGE